MNKTAIKKFAIDARNKLRESVSDKIGMLGITPDECREPITKGNDFEVYKTVAGTEVTLNKEQCNQRRELVNQIKSKGYDEIVEEVAYTWFNRICAIRFMEVNDYLPTRVRVLSSEKKGKNEPDIVTNAPDIDLDFTMEEKEYIVKAKMDNRLDELFRMLFIKQCNALHEILPELFEAIADYTEMLLNISYTNEDDVVRMLVDGIDEADFNVTTLNEDGEVTGQVEIIGWLYQYYNTELKDDTFAKLKKNIKITKERIPAATQLFTPDWIVRYMVENSVGRLWIEHLRAVNPNTDEKKTAQDYGWKYYLPEAEQEEEVNIHLAEIRTTYKDMKPTDIKCIDPCMGSGHILVAMFDVLMDIYKSAGYGEREAAFLIVENNLHGLDIDKRAYQLAYFAVMMKGRGYNRRFFRGQDDALPTPKLYAIQESNDLPSNITEELDNTFSKVFTENELECIKYVREVYVDAREYGSIIDIDEEREDRQYIEVEKKLRALYEGQHEFYNRQNYNMVATMLIREVYPKLSVLLKQAAVMEMKYDAVVTNPPYMGGKGMSSKLGDYVKKNYPDSKTDLFAVFIEKCKQLTSLNGYQAMITQHSWMFLSSFENLREKMLQTNIVNMAHLGPRAFEEIGGEVVQTTSWLMINSKVDEYKGTYARLIEPTTQQGKEELYLTGDNRYSREQENFNKIQGSPIAYWVSDNFIRAFENETLYKYSVSPSQNITGNNNKFIRKHWELDKLKIGHKDMWIFYAKGGGYRKWWGNLEDVVNWTPEARSIYQYGDGKHASQIIKSEYWYKKGITWGLISSVIPSFRVMPEGATFDKGGSTIIVEEFVYKYVLGLLNSNVYLKIARMFNPTLNYQVKDIRSTPLVLSNMGEIDRIVDNNVALSKKDWDSFETSWDFTVHPLVSNQGSNLLIENQFAKWQQECQDNFDNLKSNEEELNRIFIDIYGLQDELTPEVEDKDVSVRLADLERDIRSLLSYAVGCMFGRYSLDEEGLIYAGGEWDASKYSTFIPDADNIIPITDEEYFEDDIVGLLCNWLKKVYGEDTLEDNLDFIADALGNKGDTSREVIRNYFLKDFIKDHIKIYQKRPIYWLFDSGKENGFKALIYLHRYNADTVGRVRTDYLHKTQKAIEQALVRAEFTRDNANSGTEKSRATKNITKYNKQLAEIRQYDEAIAYIANKRIELDLDDGVKVNYAQFQGVVVKQEGKKEQKIDLLAKI